MDDDDAYFDYLYYASQKPTHCAICGKSLAKRGPTAKYCSNACKCIAYRARRARELDIDEIYALCMFCRQEMLICYRTTRRYCSAECKYQARLIRRKMARKKGAEVARQGTEALPCSGEIDNGECL